MFTGKMFPNSKTVTFQKELKDKQQKTQNLYHQMNVKCFDGEEGESILNLQLLKKASSAPPPPNPQLRNAVKRLAEPLGELLLPPIQTRVLRTHFFQPVKCSLPLRIIPF